MKISNVYINVVISITILIVQVSTTTPPTQPAVGGELRRSWRVGEEDSRRILPASIEVALGSVLRGQAGERAPIYFEVTNNRRQPVYFDYIVSDTNNWIRYVHPLRSVIDGEGSQKIKVEVEAPPEETASRSGTMDLISLRARLNTGESVTQTAYYTIGQTSYDGTSPSIWYSYNGDCSNAVGPDNCYVATWGANVTVQDSGSGLLRLGSKPVPLRLEREFVAGTTDPVYARFTASCCRTKVEITAVDLIGNKYTRIINIESKWLTAGEIAAIVLGCILIIIILACFISSIVWCCRRRRGSLPVYPDH